MAADEGLPLYIVDAFTDEAFTGNPAAVCLLDFELIISDDKLQKIAAEMNLSETAFVQPASANQSFTKGSVFNLRWFTPTNEVSLCGHATIASAAVLFFVLDNRSSKIIFETKSGSLITQRKNNSISMDFPLNRPLQQDKDEYADLLKLVVPFDWMHSVHHSPTTKKLLVRLTDDKTRSDLENLKPEISKMVSTENSGKVKGVIVTVDGQTDVKNGGVRYDFLSRYFAPWNGIPEDPVTGSAHTVLAAYWSVVHNKTELYGRQCSPRGGDLTMIVRDNDVRVDLSGKAKVVLKGRLVV